MYGVCVGDEIRFARFAGRSIEQYDPGATILKRTGFRSICRAYNSILGEARRRNATVLVLVHEDVELRGAVKTSVLDTLATTDAALIGAIGGRGVRDMAWWDAQELIGAAPDNFWQNTYQARAGDVQQIDGIFIAMSCWAIHNLEFDESRFPGFHGYDADISRQAIAAGKRVIVLPIPLIHHNRVENGSESHEWAAALYAFRSKWMAPTLRQRLVWNAKRQAHVSLARLGHARRPLVYYSGGLE